MEYFLIACQILLLSIAGIVLCYLVVLTVAAACVRFRTDFSTAELRRLAVMIPAHNEEHGIRSTIESVLSTDYSRERSRVIVIADNCTDGTAEAARRAGAIVMERSDDAKRSKGYALRWALDQLALKKEDDAFIIIDADTTVSGNYLQVINWYLSQGARAIQTSDLVVPPHADAWSAQMTRIGFLLGNLVRPLGRKAIGGTVGLRGNGMCLSADLVVEVPWESYSLAEDLEHGLRLLLRNVCVAFAPEATAFAIMPHDPKNAESQRARWEGGRFPVIRKFSWPLLRRAVMSLSIRDLDAWLDLVTPALVNFMAAVLLCAAFTMSLALVGIHSMNVFALLWCIALGLGFFHLFAGLRIAKADSSVYRSLLHIPRYAVWKIVLYMKMLGRKSGSAWIRTTREQ